MRAMITMLLVLAAQAAPAAPPRPSQLKLFRDWTVGCDNGRFCQAVALIPQGWPDGAATMGVRRGSEPGAPTRVNFELTGDADAAAASHLEADGRRIPVRLMMGETGPEAAAADMPALLSAFRSARALRIVGRSGETLGTVSLAGATASLLYMDEAQRRPAPPLPAVRSPRPGSGAPIAVTRTLAASLRKRHGCEIGEVGGPDDIEAFTIAPGTSLLLMACGSGAYNVTHIALIAQRGQTRLARYDTAETSLINAGWDKDKGLLSSYSKARGLGDCGTSQSFAWDGARFRLVHQESMGECQGSVDYITTWRARVVR